MSDARDHESVTGETPPPIGRSWRTLYLVVAGWLAMLIALFSIFTRYFR